MIAFIAKPRKFFQAFTVVELLIVVTVIGILAGIVVVGYGNIQKQAQTVAIASELKQWHALFKEYKSKFGYYPAPAAAPATGGGPGASVVNTYCLGTGFPQTSGNGWCYVTGNPSSAWAVRENTGAALLTELEKVGETPENSEKFVFDTVTGPMLRYVNVSTVYLESIFPGSSAADCPKGTTHLWNNSIRVHCAITLDYTP